MNREEVKRLDRVELEVRNNTQQLEKIITNDLPHIAENTGKLQVVIPLVIGILLLVLGLYGLVIYLVGG